MNYGNLTDVPREVTDFTVDGKCSNCGSCCSDILPLTEYDILRIRKYMNKHIVVEQKRIPFMTEVDMTCPFRDEAKRICTIYEARPEICRVFTCRKYAQNAIEKGQFQRMRKVTNVFMRSEFFGHDSLKAEFDKYAKEIGK